jgi:hypothetical protein
MSCIALNDGNFAFTVELPWPALTFTVSEYFCSLPVTGSQGRL